MQQTVRVYSTAAVPIAPISDRTDVKLLLIHTTFSVLSLQLKKLQ